MKASVKKKLNKAASITVVSSLVVICVVSFAARKLNRFTESGRVISVSDLNAEPPRVNAYAKVTYEEKEAIKNGLTYNPDGTTNLDTERAEKEAEQAERDKLALQTLMESNERAAEAIADSKSVREEVKKREKKYKLNDITALPETQVVQVAGLSPVAVPQLGTTEGAEYLGEFSLTAYCPCVICCGNTSGITASGARATANHTIAADSRFPFGTKLLINGVVYTVEDRGGAIKGNIIDIFFCTHEEACNFGRQSAHVYRIP